MTEIVKSQCPDLRPDQIDVISKIVLKFRQLGLAADWTPPVTEGIAITCYRWTPKESTRVAQLENMSKDLSIALGVKDDAIVIQRVPGEPFIGVYVPNAKPQEVRFTDIVGHIWRMDPRPKIPLAFGVDWLGVPYVEDLTDIPHLLVAGATGSGKSVATRSMAVAIVYTSNSRHVQLVISDTKQVEYGDFVGLPHLRYDVAKSPYQTLEQLDDVIDECEKRLKRFAAANVRNIKDYNALVPNDPVPYIVIIIDELADLVQFKGTKRGESKLAEEKIANIVGRARAAGVCMLASTQRPSVDVVKGVIKANFPGRLTFRLPSGDDSRTIIGSYGAEHLLTKGDMLYNSPLQSSLQRLHSPHTQQIEIQGALRASVFMDAQGHKPITIAERQLR